MFLDQLANAGSLPTLEAAMRFASQRQKLISNNIANFDTPGFIATDVSPQDFQAALNKAVTERRQRNGGMHGELNLKRTRELEPGPGGSLILKPRTPVGGVLSHDRNESDLERTMQSLVENAVSFRIAADLHRARAGVIKRAIAERAA